MPHLIRPLGSIREAEPAAAEELLSQVYRELRRVAARRMAHEAPGQTLQPTALVHEAWLRLVGDDGLLCPNRAYFFAAAGEAMRRILVENARRKKRLKRGGNRERVDIDKVDLAAPLPDETLSFIVGAQALPGIMAIAGVWSLVSFLVTLNFLVLGAANTLY